MPFSWMETGPVALPRKAQVHRSFLVIWRGSRLSLHPLLVRQALCVKDSEKEIIRQDSLLLWMPQVGVGWGNEEAFWVWKERMVRGKEKKGFLSLDRGEGTCSRAQWEILNTASAGVCQHILKDKHAVMVMITEGITRMMELSTLKIL